MKTETEKELEKKRQRIKKKARKRLIPQTITGILLLELITEAWLYGINGRKEQLLTASIISLIVPIGINLIRYVDFTIRLNAQESYYQTPGLELITQNGFVEHTLTAYDAMVEKNGRTVDLYFVTDETGKREYKKTIRKEEITSIRYLQEPKNTRFDQWVNENNNH